ncbi:MAG: histidinol-phosphate transaminase [Moraxellaceae bacterium]|nr:MAG: histidinol-phosphate transaminase [Moraxellaceae bacterium]
MSRFWSDIVHQLTPYVPGEQPKVSNLIKLNTNENPFGPSPKVLEVLKAEAADVLRLYPDPNADLLKSAVANYYSVSEKQVFVGNGSDEVLAHAFMGLLKKSKPLLFPDITYSFYPVYCGLFDVGYEIVALTDDFQINVEDYARPNGGIIFPNPNAPTGRVLPLADIEALLQANTDSVVVIDEAYIDFGGESAIALVDKYPNLLVIQTFSKSRSLAGLRVGFAVGDVDLIAGLERVKNSFNSYPLDRFAISGAAMALEDKAYFEKTRQVIIETREKLVVQLEQLGFDVLPSAGNFVFARHSEKRAVDIAARLREKSIIVRHFTQARIDNFLRITIGTDAQCAALVEALTVVLED